MSRFRAALLVGAMTAGVAPVLGPAQAQGIPVIDTMAIAKHIEQIAELGRQLDTMKQQLGEAKRLYDSVNQLTNLNDVASLLNRDEFRRTLPAEISQIERLLSGTGSDRVGALAGLVDGYLDQNRFYKGAGATGAANDFYRGELDRIARATGAKHGIGQQVYDTAARRVDELEKLRQRIGSSGTMAEKLDLANRLKAETALLQNEVLRMQGLAMVQQARSDMDAQRERERRQKISDEIDGALK